MFSYVRVDIFALRSSRFFVLGVTRVSFQQLHYQHCSWLSIAYAMQLYSIFQVLCTDFWTYGAVALIKFCSSTAADTFYLMNVIPDLMVQAKCRISSLSCSGWPNEVKYLKNKVFRGVPSFLWGCSKFFDSKTTVAVDLLNFLEPMFFCLCVYKPLNMKKWFFIFRHTKFLPGAYVAWLCWLVLCGVQTRLDFRFWNTTVSCVY